jgi:CHAT domain-containing protein
MERYYRNLLAGQGRAEALHQAMRALRAMHPHPYYWAPFIAVGRDTPLDGF